MNNKTIEKKLAAKFESWVKSIKDSKLRALVKKNTIITGGCITSMFLNEDVNGYDIYFTNIETVFAVAEYYVDSFNIIYDSKGKNNVYEYEGGRVRISLQDVLEFKKVIKTDKEKYRPVYLTDNAITLLDDIQIIIRFYGDAAEIHKNFDFSHCTNYWTSSDSRLYTNVKALECTLSQTLFYAGSLYPLASVIRTRKFIRRGWHINAGQYLKMILQLNELNLKDMKVLREQLVSVDVSYFKKLMDSLKGKEEIDIGGILQLIDEIF